jgi:phospholipid/cholesterol/gamma-HCH transport system permease protein
MALINPEAVGRPVATAWFYVRGVVGLLGHCLASLNVLRLGAVRDILQRQIYFTGVQALGAISLVALIAGVVITTQVTSFVGSNPNVTARVLLWALVRELGPLLSAIVVIARSATATASELAIMRIRGELEQLRRMGIDPIDYLVVPRVVGVTVSLLATTVYFLIIAVVTGLGFAALVRDISFTQSLTSVFVLLDLREVAVSLLKACVFGLVISATSCYYGLQVRTSVTDVPRAVTRAVLQNVIMLFLLDAVITYFFFV